MTIQSNLVCRYHIRHQKRKEFDASSTNLVEGVAYRPKYGSKANPVKPEEGYMNCGCLIDDVLYDFFFWKTWSISSTRPNLAGRTETMKSDVLKPRVRSFIIKIFKEITLLTTHDLYGNYKVPRELQGGKLDDCIRSEVAACLVETHFHPSSVDHQRSKCQERGGKGDDQSICLKVMIL